MGLIAGDTEQKLFNPLLMHLKKGHARSLVLICPSPVMMY